MNKLAFVWLLMRSNITFLIFHLILLMMCPLEFIVVKVAFFIQGLLMHYLRRCV